MPKVTQGSRLMRRHQRFANLLNIFITLYLLSITRASAVYFVKQETDLTLVLTHGIKLTGGQFQTKKIEENNSVDN